MHAGAPAVGRLLRSFGVGSLSAVQEKRRKPSSPGRTSGIRSPLSTLAYGGVSLLSSAVALMQAPRTRTPGSLNGDPPRHGFLGGGEYAKRFLQCGPREGAQIGHIDVVVEGLGRADSVGVMSQLQVRHAHERFAK